MYRKKNLVGDEEGGADDDAADAAYTEPASGDAAAKGAPRKRKHAPQPSDDEDDEEEVVNSSSTSAARKAARPSSAGDADDDDVPEDYDSADEYDSDLYKGEEDRKVLEAMKEVDREMILGARHEKRLQRLETLKVRKAIREQKAQRGAAAEKQRGSQRGSERAVGRAQQDKVSKLRELGMRRNEKETRKERDREAQLETEREQAEASFDMPEPERSERPSGLAEADEDAAPAQALTIRSEVEESVEPTAASAPAWHFDPPAPPEELERIRLTRSKIEKWLVEPYFEKVVVGCFVRLGIGKANERPIYRVAEVMGVKDGYKPYRMGERMTNKRLDLKIGGSSRAVQMDTISNHNFEISELNTYERIMREEGLKGKTQNEIDEKLRDLMSYKDYAYTDQEISQMVSEQKRTAVSQRGSLASRKVKLEIQLTAAKEMGDEAEEQRLLGELDKLRATEELTKQIEEKREGASFRIKDINMRNLDFQRKVGDLAGAREAKAQAKGEAVYSDPFARIINRPTLYWTVKTKKEREVEAANAEAADAPAAPAAAAPAPVTAPLVVDVASAAAAKDPVSPGFKELLATPRSADDLTSPKPVATDPIVPFSSLPLREQKLGSKGAGSKLPEIAGKRAEAHNLSLEIDIDEISANPLPKPRPAVAPSSTALASANGAARPRTTLSVTDYKRRMGIL
uniref:Plus3 domain-containing protein n=1 Tax=Chrysotila carterae TaxID=13221 RepID=A0A7S4BIC5_CHRCT|mmetsp:Transcript_42259/g.92622  ORF Transcript_42259/g.92622 Transcript_42259/m.92622 type:complete len:686 (+) Transcript_42259:153-2210(+)